MEVLADQFWDYVVKATQTAEETIQMIRKSQFGQDVRYVWRHRHCIHIAWTVKIICVIGTAHLILLAN